MASEDGKHVLFRFAITDSKQFRSGKMLEDKEDLEDTKEL